MICKFECSDCKTRFEADDRENVICPHCKSDNVDYAKTHISSKVWMAVAIIAVLVALVCVALHIEWGKESGDGMVICGGHISDTTEVVIVPGLDVPPTIEVGDLIFEEGGYSFTVVVKNRPSAKAYVAVINPINNQTISKSEDGVFKDIPSSEADGSFYTIALMDAAKDSVLTSMEKPGFIKQAKVARKMSVEELQRKIESRDDSLMGLGENDYLSPDLTLKFVGLPADAVNVPTILSEVFEKLDMEIWSSVLVSNLEYDEMNRIKTITLKVNQ